MRDFTKLAVWTRAHVLTCRIYRSTRMFPREEVYGLVSQVRKASVSVCANIAEGCGRGEIREFRRFLRISLGSACELHSLILLSIDLGFLDRLEGSGLSDQVVEVKKMLWSLLRSLNEGEV